MFTIYVFVSFSSNKILCNSAGKHIDMMSLGQKNGQRNQRFTANKNTLTVLKSVDAPQKFKKSTLFFSHSIPL